MSEDLIERPRGPQLLTAQGSVWLELRVPPNAHLKLRGECDVWEKLEQRSFGAAAWKLLDMTSWSRLDTSRTWMVWHDDKRKRQLVAYCFAAQAIDVIRGASAGRITLVRLAVSPRWRRLGVARWLMDQIGKTTEYVGTAPVPESNLAMQLTLRSAGFLCTRTLRTPFDPPSCEDGYVFDRATPAALVSSTRVSPGRTVRHRQTRES